MWFLNKKRSFVSKIKFYLTQMFEWKVVNVIPIKQNKFQLERKRKEKWFKPVWKIGNRAFYN